MSHEEEATLNIGALSMATGVPVETIRTWERRYGFPRSSRNEAGHRIYDLGTIEHLRLITAILAQGYRPSQLEGQSREELEDLLEMSTGGEHRVALGRGDECEGEQTCRDWMECWFKAVTTLNREELEGYLRCDFSRMNALEFLEQRLDPFLREIGEGWASGKLSVLHEHFASECIRDFLVHAWRQMSGFANGPSVVLATFSGELHSLGLHMAALTMAMADCKVVFLGPNTPVEDIATASAQSEARAVAVSISESADRKATLQHLGQLRELVESEIAIVIGGKGAPRGFPQVVTVEGFDELFEYFSTD